MFTKILIANRGAIATRIIRTLQGMGVQAVAVYAKADQDSLHVKMADEAYCLGEGNASQTYLNQSKILQIAEQSGAQAVHPGYGFLSENPEFVGRCEAQGLVFIGPTPSQMQAFGLKHTARELAAKQGVPLLSGSDLLDSLPQALAQAEVIGYPVMLKSTAGGGGIGMQVCPDAHTLTHAYASVKRLSENNFANSGLFLEKYIAQARHIEVQIFGDGQGDAIALGERDCSAQRRNQKVIEETPAPNLTDEVRQQLQAVAVRLVQAVHYRNAGTVEFVYDKTQDQFYFLEVNTRLQVEHGVTEQVYGVDLVEWMVRLAANELAPLSQLKAKLRPTGHAIQVRIYAEDPHKNFQPSAGLLSHVQWPEADGQALRIDHWIEAGMEISPFFDPMLAKVIAHGFDRAQALKGLMRALAQTQIYGIETNKAYVSDVLRHDVFRAGEIDTRFLNQFSQSAARIDVLVAGTQTTLQDYPGRVGYWDVGVPPSGPFDAYSFQLGNALLGNASNAAGLEITLNGPTLRFTQPCQIVLTGAEMQARLDDTPLDFWQVQQVEAGQVLKLGKVTQAGARSYLLVQGGIDCPDYLGAKATFTLGQFGGHVGRALRVGDVLAIGTSTASAPQQTIAAALRPAISSTWTIHVMYGPHGAPDFFTAQDIQTFFNSRWKIHYNSSRTGVRLIGPKPTWARRDGGEAGMHPSNIHDNAYAIGAIDFTGDMPVILGPDGPSLGGFVCPATVIAADLWKLGQLKAGDTVEFIPVSLDDALRLERWQQQQISTLTALEPPVITPYLPATPIVKTLSAESYGEAVVYRPAGDKYLLVEYGPWVLDIQLRFRVHALMLWLQQHPLQGMQELTPGIRSLQIHYDGLVLPLNQLLAHLELAESHLTQIEELEVPARIVHLPLSWDDAACQQAIDKYVQSVRKDAPWCPSNIEFIRRINGLESVEAVKQIVFDASYLVMGLGDVYLGAPVATPLDPRHRLVTTKYNPARTWTAENSVGIGGSYLCVYGMEGPGGYQFIGRTLQMWNRYRQSAEFTQPWLLRFFDQIRFYPVSAQELIQIREDFPQGRYPLRIENTCFKLKDYQQFLQDHQTSIDAFTTQREQAFDQELQRWIESGQINFAASNEDESAAPTQFIADDELSVDSPVAGSVWQLQVAEGAQVQEGDCLAVIESMKMEIEVLSPVTGVVQRMGRQVGQSVQAGQSILVIKEQAHG